MHPDSYVVTAVAVAQLKDPYTNYVSHGSDLSIVRDIIRVFPEPDVGWESPMNARSLTELFGITTDARLQQCNTPVTTKTEFKRLITDLSRNDVPS